MFTKMKTQKPIHTLHIVCILCRRWKRLCIRQKNFKKCDNCIKKNIKCIRFKPANMKDSIINLLNENNKLKKELKLYNSSLQELKLIIKEKNKVDKQLKKIINK